MMIIRFVALLHILWLASVFTETAEGIDGTSCQEFDEVSALQQYSVLRPARHREAAGFQQPQFEGEEPMLASPFRGASRFADQGPLSFAEQAARLSPVRWDEQQAAVRGEYAPALQEMQTSLLDFQRPRTGEPASELYAGAASGRIALSAPDMSVAAEKRSSMRSSDEARTPPSDLFDTFVNAARSNAVSQSEADATLMKLDALIQEEKATVASQYQALQAMNSPQLLQYQSPSQASAMLHLLPGSSQVSEAPQAGQEYLAIAVANTTIDVDNNGTRKVDKAVLVALEFLPFLGCLGIPRMYMGCWLTGILQCLVFCLSCGIVGTIWGVVDLILIVINAVNLETSIDTFGMGADFDKNSLGSAKTLAWIAVAIWSVYSLSLCFGYVKFFQNYY